MFGWFKRYDANHVSILLLFIVYCAVLTCGYDDPTTSMRPKPKVVGFWNIYAEGPHFRSIINEQKRVIETSGLIDEVGTVFYTTMGDSGESLLLDGIKFTHLKHFGPVGNESQTLTLLYNYCHSNPSDKVFYFHNKGSLNNGVLNTNMRRALDCFVLNPYCIPALDLFDTCGWRISPLPHIHYSGNYWWARCSHVNTLIHPMIPYYNTTFLALTSKLYDKNKRTKERPSASNPFPDQPYLGLGRYFAETWLGSAPMFRPADCMNATTNNRYMWGKVPLPWRMVNKRCPNYATDFMSSSTIQQPLTVQAGPKTAVDIPHGSSELSINPARHVRVVPAGKNEQSFTDIKYQNSEDTTTAKVSVEQNKSQIAHVSGTVVTPQPQLKQLHYGLPCGLAGMIAQPRVMQKRLRISMLNFTQELNERSLYWYGERPLLQLQWLSLYKEENNIPWRPTK